MKDKIIMFVIGALVGAILTGGGFLLFGNRGPGGMGQRGEMPPEGEFQEMNGTRPERRAPDGNQVAPNNETTVDSSIQEGNTSET